MVGRERRVVRGGVGQRKECVQITWHELSKNKKALFKTKIIISKKLLIIYFFACVHVCVLMCMSMCVHVEGYAHVWPCFRKLELNVRGLLQSLSTLYFETVSPTKMRT